MRPDPTDYDFDLDEALRAVVAIRSTIPEDGYTAEVLGTERAGSGVHIGDGLILTVGYLVAEADSVWIIGADNAAVPGHVMAYDYETGFGLVMALGRLNLPALPMGDSNLLEPGDDVVLGGAGGRDASLAARVIARQEFAGYWEYLLEDALFTAPAHDNWGGTALIGPSGELLGIGSLLIQASSEGSEAESHNMVVPINTVKPVLSDLMSFGRPNHPARPWLGLYATEMEGHLVIAELASHGPAEDADLRSGDIILTVGGEPVASLAEFFRQVWDQGQAGTIVPLEIYRDGELLNVAILSADRREYLKSPIAH